MYWDEVIDFVRDLSVQHGTVAALDLARGVFLKMINEITERETILYAMSGEASVDGSIDFGDVHGMMAVMPGLEGKDLDLILHSGGGSGESAKAIVDYLRLRFDHIRIIIPNMAMSAATMLACGADEIVMGKYSFLGPIDPQYIMGTPMGRRFVAAQNILDQFEMAKRDLSAGVPVSAWSSMLTAYGPDLLASCQSARGLSEDIVRTLLASYMLKGNQQKANEIAAWLSDHKNFLSHGRFISRPEAQEKGLVVKNLEGAKADGTSSPDEVDGIQPGLQDAVLSLFHVLALTFEVTETTKVIENHNGTAFLRLGLPFPVPSRFPSRPAAEQQGDEEEPESGENQGTDNEPEKKDDDFQTPGTKG